MYKHSRGSTAKVEVLNSESHVLPFVSRCNDSLPTRIINGWSTSGPFGRVKKIKVDHDARMSASAAVELLVVCSSSNWKSEWPNCHREIAMA